MIIKRMVQLGALSTVAILLTGCGGAGHYASAVHSWQGAPRTALVHDWGHPNSVSELSNGNVLYTYRVVEHEPIVKTYSPAPYGFVRLSPQNNNTVVLSHPAVVTHHQESFWCETSFEINKRNVIVNTHYKGNNCVATKAGAHRWAFAH